MSNSSRRSSISTTNSATSSSADTLSSHGSHNHARTHDSRHRPFTQKRKSFLFQTYILPPLSRLHRKVRRRTRASTSTTSTTSDSSSTSPTTTNFTSLARARPTYLTNHLGTISCLRCHAHLALTTQIISKGFTGRHGRAYLVASHPPPFLNPTFSTFEEETHNTTTSPTPHNKVPNSHAFSNDPQPIQSSPTYHPTPLFGIPGADPLPNTVTHHPVTRQLVTGVHAVSDVTCAVCGSLLGWKYVSANDAAQQYKVGKYILETRRTVVESEWECAGTVQDGWEEGAEALGIGRDDLLASRFGSEDDDHDSGAAESSPGSHTVKTTPDWNFGAETAVKRRVQGGDPSSVCEEIMFDSQDEDDCEELFAGVWNPVRARRRRFRSGVGARQGG
ncbi:MAG: hypothetical protein M1831_001157 [Alyxoria varia]|nr:MAG: hypothetical protein M1831_001157 [Alyxoria varia]